MPIIEILENTNKKKIKISDIIKFLIFIFWLLKNIHTYVGGVNAVCAISQCNYWVILLLIHKISQHRYLIVASKLREAPALAAVCPPDCRSPRTSPGLSGNGVYDLWWRGSSSPTKSGLWAILHDRNYTSMWW
jgi:hypothetical protein